MKLPFGFNGKSQLVGIDVGSYAVKIVETDTKKNQVILKNVGMALLPLGSVEKGQIKEAELVVKILKDLVNRLNIKNKNICTSVSGVSCILKKLPTVRDKTIEEIESGLKEEIEQYIPFDIADVYMDHAIFFPAGQKPKPNEKVAEAEILVAVASKDLVDSYTKIFEMADLNPVVMDVGILAVQNAVEFSNPELSWEYIVVDIGAENTVIHVVRNGLPVFTRDAPIGGYILTRSIMEAFGVDYLEAESIKTGATSVDSQKAGILKDLFIKYITDCVEEITSALAYIVSIFPDFSPQRFFLTGGGSLVPHFAKAIEFKTNLNVVRTNPFERLIVNSKHFDPKYIEAISPFMTKAVGLAFREGKER